MNRTSREPTTDKGRGRQFVVKPVIDASRGQIQLEILREFVAFGVHLLEEMQRLAIAISPDIRALTQDAHPESDFTLVAIVTVDVETDVDLSTGVFAACKLFVKLADDEATACHGVEESGILKLTQEGREIAPAFEAVAEFETLTCSRAMTLAGEGAERQERQF